MSSLSATAPLVSGYHSLRHFLSGKPMEGLRWDWMHFEYDRLVARYVELFGSENVKVLPYELLTTSPDRFLDELCEFCGAVGYEPLFACLSVFDLAAVAIVWVVLGERSGPRRAALAVGAE